MTRKTKYGEPWFLWDDDGSDFTVIATRPKVQNDGQTELSVEVLGVSEWLRCAPSALKRIVECVNAMQGIEDPMELRWALDELWGITMD